MVLGIFLELKMKQFIVLAAVVAVVAAGQGGDVDEALLARVAQILGGSSSGGSSGGGSSFGRSSGGGSSGYAPPSDSYGPPSSGGGGDFGRSSGGSSGGGVQIGTPERAQRVAEFELSSGASNTRDGPSSSYGAPPSSGYGAPSGGGGAQGVRSGGSGGVDLGRPERAERVAEFSLSGGSNGGGSRSGGNGGGYN